MSWFGFIPVRMITSKLLPTSLSTWILVVGLYIKMIEPHSPLAPRGRRIGIMPDRDIGAFLALDLGCQIFSSDAGLTFLVGGLEHDFYFSIQLGIIIPIDFHIFQRDRSTTNQQSLVPKFGTMLPCWS